MQSSTFHVSEVVVTDMLKIVLYQVLHKELMRSAHVSFLSSLANVKEKGFPGKRFKINVIC